MDAIIQRASDRGSANLGWLNTKYSFSFSRYYNPSRVGFGALLVLNDDTIAAYSGFPTHEHQNMEIITIVFSGELTHKDNTGSTGRITSGQVQVMSAGTGIQHSEYNESEKEVELLQIWIQANKKNVRPRYQTKSFTYQENTLTKIVTGVQESSALFIHQDASIYFGVLTRGNRQLYTAFAGRGVFIMIVEGSITLGEEKLYKRDSIEIRGISKISITSNEQTTLILIDVPLH